MNSTNRLRIIVDASTEGARGAMQKMVSAMGDVKASFDTFKADGEKIYAAVAKGLDATVGATVRYAGEVRDLSRAMGASAEDASVLIQAGDDLGISFEALEQASRQLNQRGIQPSIDNLAAMADEYNQLRDPVARAQYAIDKFGMRAGPEMQKLLEKGSRGLHEMADEAREAGLVMSGQTVAAARELELSLDALSDTGQGLALTIGTELLPVVNDLVDIAERAAPAVGKMAEQFVVAWEAGEQLWKIQKLLMLEVAAWVSGADQQAKILAAQTILNDGLTDAQLREAAATESQRKHWELVADFYRNQAGPATDELIGKTNDLKLAQSDLALALDGPIAASQAEYYERQRDAGAAIVETQDRIKELTALPQLTDQQRAELGELQTLLLTQQQTYADNATEHEKSTARIVFSMLQQRLAVDGLSQAEYTFLTDIGEEWGIYDKETAEVLRNVDSALAEHGLNATAVVDDLAGSIRNLPDNKLVSIEVRTNYTRYGEEPGPAADLRVPVGPNYERDGQRAMGGPVRGGGLYTVGERGEELFVAPPHGGFILDHHDAMAIAALAAGQAQGNSQPAQNVTHETHLHVGPIHYAHQDERTLTQDLRLFSRLYQRVR
jgi:hypothetical protein